jgi:hypothetical protein
MRIDNTRNKRKSKSRKREQSWFEKEFFHIMEQSLKITIDQALDEVLKDLNGGSANISI